MNASFPLWSSRLLSLMVMALICALPMAAQAASTDWQAAEFSKARLVTGKFFAETEDGAADQLDTVIDLKLTDGWKTYWRSPGDAGFPLSVEILPESQNIESTKLLWPFPKRFIEEWGLEVFGFKKGVTVPMRLKLKDPEADSKMALKVNYAVCSDICLTEELIFHLDLPVSTDLNEADVKLVEEALQFVPEEDDAAALNIGQPKIIFESEGAGQLRVPVNSEDGVIDSKADLFIEGAVGLRFPIAELTRSDDKKSGDFVVPYEVSLPAKTLAGEDITLTLVSGSDSVENRYEKLAKPQDDAPMAMADPTTDVPQSKDNNTLALDAESGDMDDMLLPMILFALIGGLILNIMPCVLPVLSIKMLGIAKHGGGDKKEVRLSFLVTVLGILSFFVGLAVFTILTKHAGEAVGWGLHFQSTPFLAFIATLILLFAANLLGIFEISLPQFLNTHIYEAGQAGKQQRQHLVGDFATGAFAALMATPCTAPFLGTAIAFALARGDAEILIIFTALGFGLAIPYFLAALFPQIATKLPKPGMWMVRIKQLMGILMFIAALWLIYVLVNQAGSVHAIFVMIISAVMGLVLHGRERWQSLRRKGRVPLLLIGLTLLLYFVSIVPPADHSLHAQRERMVEQVEWMSFEPETIPGLVESGKVVFLDVTADWCLTCKANKLYSLGDEEVMEALQQKHVVAMQGDLTRPNKEIEKFLRQHKRYGIPFNIVYGPSSKGGEVLPELLTPKIVLEALDKAK